MWLVAVAMAAPPAAVRWVADVQLGARPDQVAEVLRKDGATVTELDYHQPGAFARSLLDPPGLLAQLHRAHADVPLFDGLPATGPKFVVAEGPDGRASYAFVGGKLQAMALTLTATAIAPNPDPFRRDRLEPLNAAVAALCAGLRPTERDDYGNAVGWRGDHCAGGTLAARYDPLDPAAALQVVVFASR